VSSTEKVCGCLGCSEPAHAVIDHEDAGRRTVCEDHINDHEVELYLTQTGLDEFVTGGEDDG